MATTTVLVTQLTGQAWIRDADGNLMPLREGMSIPSDANVITASGSTVQLQADGQPPLTLGENQNVALNQGVFEDIPAAEAAVPAAADPLVDNLIAAINSGQDPLAELDPTAATMAGGGGGGGTFVRLSSVVEGTSPLALAYPRGASEVPEERRGGAAAAVDTAESPVENAPPLARPDMAIAEEDSGPVTGNVLNNDSDPENQPLQVTQFVVDGKAYQVGEVATIVGIGSLTIGRDGVYAFMPEANWSGKVPQVTYTVSDGASTDTSTLGIEVTPVNDAPETENTAGKGDEDKPVTVELKGSDVDGTVKEFVIKSLPTDGKLMFNGQELAVGSKVPATNDGAQITFEPNANWNGQTTFTYASVDNDGLEDPTPATGTITVDAVNDAPETENTAGKGDEDKPVTVELKGSDVDGTVKEFVIKSLPTDGKLMFNGQELAVGSKVPATNDGAQITFEPNANWNGQTTFTYASVDNDGLEDPTPATGTITVDAVNDAPETENTAGKGDEDKPVTVELKGSDVDGTVKEFVIKSLPTDGKLMFNGQELAVGSKVPATNDGAQITFEPNANWNGQTTFTYASVDNDGLEDPTPATGTITVDAVNDAPETENTAGKGDEDKPVTVELKGSDVDGTVKEFVIKSLPTDGKLMFNGQELAVGSKVPATNDGAQITFEPNANWNGQTTFTYASVDNDGLEDPTPATGTITVDAVNDAPETENTAGKGDEDKPVTVELKGSDVDGTVKEFVIKSLPTDGKLMFNGQELAVGSKVPATNDGAQITFEPNANWNGQTTFTYASVDNDGLEDPTPATGTITVDAVNDAPETENTAGKGDEDKPVTVELKGSDVDGTVKEFVIKSLPTDGKLMFNGQELAVGSKVPATNDGAQITFEPNANWNGQTTFTYASVDNDGLEDPTPATGTITVDAVNDAPETENTAGKGDEDKPVTVELKGSDVDGTVKEFVIKSLPTDGKLMFNGQELAVGSKVPATNDGAQITFEPNANWNGQTTFTYASVDNDGLEDPTPATGTITVDAVNDAPETENTAGKGDEDKPVTVELKGSDVDGTVKEFVIKSLPTDGKLMFNGQELAVGSKVPATNDGAQITFEPNANWNGQTTFTYASVDNDGLEDPTPATGTITVDAVNDAPETENTAGKGDEDKPVTVELKGSDVDGTVKEFVIKSLPTDGKLMFNGQELAVGSKVPATNDGAQITFEPNANWNGQTTFTYASVDNDGLEDPTPATGTITVDAVNDAPETENTAGKGDEDKPVTVELKGSDVDGTVKEFVIKSLPTDGKLMFNGQELAVGSKVPATNDGAQITFEPNANWNGQTTFTYASVDNDGLEDPTPATGTITVDAVNDAPETENTAGKGDEDKPVTVELKGSDVDGTVKEFVIKSLPTDGKLMFNGQELAVGSKVPATNDGAQITFEPNANWNGQTTFTYASVDNDGLEDPTPATGTITVDAVNDAPETENTAGKGDEDKPVTVELKGSDVDGTVKEFVIKSLPTDGKLMFNGQELAVGSKVPATNDGAQITFEPNANWNGQTTFTYASVDNDGLEDPTPATGTITVDAVNDAPETENTAGKGDEDKPVTVELKGSDVDGTVKEFVIKSLPTDGKLMFNGQELAVGSKVPATNDGAQITFEPNANWNGQTTFTYASVDNDGLEDPTPATGTITVDAVNDAPETENTAGKGDEDKPVTVELKGSDVDGTVKEFVIKSLPTDGKLMFNGQELAVGSKVPATNDGAQITFEPNANWNGQTTFTYASVDNDGLEDPTPATGTITVDAVNDAPETENTAGKGDEDKPVTVELKGSDVDGTVKEFVIKSLPTDGKLMFNGQELAVGSKVPATNDGAQITFEPNANWNGQTTFTYASVDNDGLEDPTPATGTITVDAVNDAPETENTAGKGDEDKPVTVELKGSDVDGTVKEFVIKSLPTDGKLMFNGQELAVGSKVPATNDGAQITFEPNANWNGQTTFTYASVDNDGLEDPTPATGTITVDAVNDAPETENTAGKGDEDKPVTVELKGSDVDGTVKEFVIKSLPTDGKLMFNGQELAVGSKVPATNDGAQITFEPNANWNGQTTFTYASVDNDGLEDPTPATGTITVDAVNDAPETENTAGKGDEDKPVTVELKGSDVDGTVKEFVIKSLPTDGKLMFNGQELAVGSKVPATNDGAQITFEPNANWNGQTTFTYASVDNDGLEDPTPATGTITVDAVNDAPETENTAGKGDEDKPVTVELKGSDVDGTVKEFVIKSLPTDGKLMFNGQELAVGSKVPATNDGAQITFEPNANWNGQTTFTYASVDNDGLEDPTPATGTITVDAVNDAPETENTAGKGDEDKPVTVELKGSDVDGTVKEFVIKSLPTDGKLMFNGQELAVGSKVPATNDGAQITFEPNANWNGQTTFTYASVDNDGLEDPTPATGTITVDAVNDAPETENTAGKGDEDKPVTVELKGSDVDGTVKEFVIKSLPTDGKLMFNGQELAVGSKVPATNDGAQITFEPNANWNGQTTFTYASVDNDGLEDPTPATGTITVDAVNDAPETENTAGKGDEDKPVTVELKGSDVDGTVKEFVIKSLPTDGKLMFNGQELAVGSKVPATNDGAQITFEPNANWNGQTTFTYASVDNDGLEDPTPATGTITVDAVNDAPEISSGTANVSEEGLAGGIADTQGSSDTTNSRIATGALAISDVDDASGHKVRLLVPTANLTSGGKPVIWSLSSDGHTLTGKTAGAGGKTVMEITMDDGGGYKVELKAPVDHPDAGKEDLSSFHVSVEVTDPHGAKGSATLTVNIEDDSPSGNPIKVDGLDVLVSSITVGKLSTGFVNGKLEGGGAPAGSNTDSDPGIDKITWGGGSKPSGYEFVDNEGLRADKPDLLNTKFELGTFTHNNFPISGNALTSVDLEVSIYVVIDGVETMVKKTISFKHTETSNNGTAEQNRDIVEITNSTAIQTFTVGGRTYVLNILGFLDESGKLVSKINTWEDKSNSYKLYASIESTDDLPRVEGNMSDTPPAWNYGADGAGSVTWGGGDVKTVNGKTVITNEYGTLTVDANGHYSFVMSRDARDNFKAGDKPLVYAYTVKDADGDFQQGTLTIDMHGIKNLPSIPLVEAPAEHVEVGNATGVVIVGSTGINVGRDILGAQMAVTGANQQSLHGKPVTALVTANGAEHEITLTSGGHALSYKANVDGSLSAGYQSGGVWNEVFVVTGSAINGTYSVEMKGIVDPVNSYSDFTPGASGEASISLVKASSTSTIEHTSSGVKLTLSAFLDKGGVDSVKDASDTAAKLIVDTGSNRGVSIDNPNWSSSGADDRYIQNNTENGNNSDGAYGEKLVLDFSANIEGSKHISKVQLTLNQFGDREADARREAKGNEDKAQITVFYTDGKSAVIDVAADARTWGQSSNADTGTKSVVIEAPAGKDIQSIVIGAGDTDSTFSLDRNIKVDWSVDAKITDYPVTNDALQLHLGATVTDGTGDKASTNFDVSISNSFGVSPLMQSMSVMAVDEASVDQDHEVHGTSGNDILIGTGKDDLFIWHQGDEGTVAAPAEDVVQGFGISSSDNSAGHDKLDLHDLLQGEENAADLSKFLHFGVEGGSTVIKVSSDGTLAADGTNFDQKITLEGVTWKDPGNDANAQNELIKDLIKQGKLVVDGNHQ
ncbi:retention module-containing protein [Comamonas sp. GB3 AK4-5]|uniref:retention module-containing protein n=1 Tax=Comamonas sp. GB3 AK4-5 TaxID=3231487 RepID=UPI00351DFE76